MRSAIILPASPPTVSQSGLPSGEPSETRGEAKKRFAFFVPNRTPLLELLPPSRGSGGMKQRAQDLSGTTEELAEAK
jgi:hypothetical protein